MQKIASPQQLQAEIQTLLQDCRGPVRPSRAEMATRLRTLAGRVAMEFSSPEALKEYLKEHPKADPKHHTVNKSRGQSGAADKVERAVNDAARGGAKSIGYNASSVKNVLKGMEGLSGQKLQHAAKIIHSEVSDAHGAAQKMRDDIDKKLEEHADDMTQDQVDALEALSSKLNEKVLKPLSKAKKDQASSSMAGAKPKDTMETSKSSLKALTDATEFLKTL